MFFESVREFADDPCDDWTVPSYLAWPTALWLANARSLNRLVPRSLGSTDIRRKLGRTDARDIREPPHSRRHSGWFSAALGIAFLDSLAGFGREGRGKYEAGAEWWWSWNRPVIEANWELWGTRCSHRHPVDMRKVWDYSRRSLWLYYRRQRTECWTWKRWACTSKPFVVS